MEYGAPNEVPREPGRWQAIALAILVHGVLLALLWFGVSWQSQTPVAVEAEVWNVKAQEAAPRARAQSVEAQQSPPEPKVRAQTPVQAPKPAMASPTESKTPDIALEREKAIKDQQRKRELEEAQKQREKLAKHDETLRKEKLLQQQKLQAKEKLEAKEKLQELQRQAQLAEATAKKKIDDQKKLAAAKTKAESIDKRHKDDVLEEQKLAAQRADNLRRMTDSANVGSGGNGEAAKSQGMRADASYIQKVGAKIKSNTVFNGAEELDRNPAAEFAVELLPDGSIRQLRKTKSSGVPGFDEAVSRAIEKSQPYPADKSGAPPSGFTVSHKPKDQ